MIWYIHFLPFLRVENNGLHLCFKQLLQGTFSYLRWHVNTCTGEISTHVPVAAESWSKPGNKIDRFRVSGGQECR